MKLTDELFEQLYAVERECFGESWSRDTLFKELENPLSAVVTEQCSGRVIGFALAKLAADESELYQIGVLPEFRREHIGSRLLTALHKTLSEHGAVCCFLEVRSRNSPAIALYEGHGYRQIAVRRGYYGDDDALIYRTELSRKEDDNEETV